MLSRKGDGAYTKILGSSQTDDSVPWYFEEFASEGKYVVLVSRQKPPKLERSEGITSYTDELSDTDADANSEESDIPSRPDSKLYPGS